MRALLFLLLSSCAAPHAIMDAPPHDAAALDRLRDAFLARARKAGRTLPFTPEMREWTRPSLMSWRAEAHAVAVPRWEELSPEQRALVERMAGDTCRPERLFAWLFRWFLLPHELAHALQDQTHTNMSHYAAEQLANDLAAAFLMEQPDGPRRLAALAQLLDAAAPRLPAPGGPDDFEQHYANLPLERYGAYQVSFIRKSLARRQQLAFDHLVQRWL
jgi:hypothetical protein